MIAYPLVQADFLDKLLFPQIQECGNQLVIILIKQIADMTYSEYGVLHAATIRTNPHAVLVLNLQEDFVC